MCTVNRDIFKIKTSKCFEHKDYQCSFLSCSGKSRSKYFPSVGSIIISATWSTQGTTGKIEANAAQTGINALTLGGKLFA